MARQVTDTLLMISPDSFGFNEETASTNVFMHADGRSPEDVRQEAVVEFRGMVELLTRHGIRVLTVPSRPDVATPDAVFPNNWISHEEGGQWILYPMLAPTRRLERQWEAVRKVAEGIVDTQQVIDLTVLEEEGKILEGTGSLVLDRVRRVAFAVESPRTTKAALEVFSQRAGYRPVVFHAYGEDGSPVYHTNVVMGIGPGFVVVCFDAIKDKEEQRMVQKELSELGLEIIPISFAQMYAFCGNILGVVNKKGEAKIIMSQTSFDAFDETQKKRLSSYGELVPVSIRTIETIGGGSARCMVAEIFA